MKKLLVISALIFSPLVSAQTESSFNYNMIRADLHLTRYDNDEARSNGASVSQSIGILREIAPNILFNAFGGTSLSKYNYPSYEVEADGVGFGMDLGTYAPINNRLDVIGTIGISHQRYSAKITGNYFNEKITDSVTSKNLNLGARIFLHPNQKIELYPSLLISRAEGETFKDFSIDMGFKLNTAIQLIIGYSTPLENDSDTDTNTFSLGLYFHQ